MEWVETTGRSVQEAKERALDELGVDEADAEFEVVAEAQTGLFGRLRSEARVRARVRPTAPRPKEDRRDRRRRSGGRGAGSTTASGPGTAGSPAEVASSGPGPGAPPATEPAQGRRTPAASEKAGSAAEPRNGDEGDGESASSRSARRRRNRRQRGSGDRASGDRSGDAAASIGTPSEGDAGARSRGPGTKSLAEGADRPGRGPRVNARSVEAVEDDFEDDEAKGSDVEVDLDRQAEVAADFLKGLVNAFGLEASVAVVRPDSDTAEVQLTGSDLGILIGPKGATLLAIQNLARTVVFNQTGANNGHVNVDVGGYRQKRTEALTRFATDVANRVKDTGVRTALEPMSAVDRKIVHDTIAGIDGVNTISEGEEPRRRVVVLPG